jgi:outer membrane murein-binding lipoprotein Lpp
MEPGFSALRNLLYVVLVLVALSVLSSFYVASQLSRNSDELVSMRVLLQKQMMGDVMTQSQELQKRMEALNQDAAGIDSKMQKAQDDMVARLKTEMPKIMDNYVKSRTPGVEKQAQKELQKRGVPTQ